MARGEPQRAVDILLDAIPRSVRLPDAYLWGKAYALDVLCDLGVQQRMPQAPWWIDELQRLAARSGMREFSVRSHLHRARLGDSASASAARLLAQEIDNPLLRSQVSGPPQGRAST